MEKKILPIMTLFGVDHTECIQKYNTGVYKYTNIPIVEGKVINIDKVFNKMLPHDIDAPAFSFKPDNADSFDVYTTLCNINDNTLCWWSRIPVGYLANGKMEDFRLRNLGIPIKFETVVLNKKRIHKIYTTGVSISYRCSYRYAEQKYKEGDKSQNWLTSMELSKMLHETYFKEKFKPANNWELLKHNGGCLEINEWIEDYLPIKRNYFINIMHKREYYSV